MVTPTHPQPLDSEITLLDAPGGREVRLRFEGPFEGGTVLWNATFRVAQPGESNAIEIGEEGEDGMALTVTLALPCFDLPAIRKSVIMVRQYRRLHKGRHQFGST